MSKKLLLCAILFLGFNSIVCELLSQLTPLPVGHIGKKDSLVILYNVQINTGLPAGVSSISNQGTVGGSNFSSKLTDDPKTAATDDATVTVLDVPPFVMGINRQNPLQEVTNATMVVFRVQFSEAVTGVDGSDFTLVTVSGGVSGSIQSTVNSVTGSNDTEYDITVHTVSGNGVLRLDLNGTGTGIKDNSNADISSGFTTGETYTIDQALPTVTVNEASGQADPVNSSPINFTVVFSEAVTGFTASDISIGGSAGATTAVISEVSPMDGTTFNVAISGMNGIGSVTASLSAGVVQDAAGNGNSASTSTDNLVYFDATPPAITINQAVGQADPAEDVSSILFTVVFSERVTGFVSGDVSISGSAGATAVVVSETAPMNGTTYQVEVGGMMANGSVIVSIGAGIAVDTANNPNTASTSTDNTVDYINNNPSVTINQSEGQDDPTSVSPIIFTVEFSEPVSGFTGADIQLSGTAGATTVLIAEISPNNGTRFHAAVSGMTGSGTVIASIAAGSVVDGTGLSNTISTSTDNTVAFIACQITCPSNIIVDATAGSCGAVVNYNEAVTSGNCGTLNYSHNSGSVFPVGVTVVTVTSASTGQSCQFNITVLDKEAPSVVCTGTKTVQTDDNVCFYTHEGPGWDATGSDVCGTVNFSYTLNGASSGSGSSLNGQVFNKGVTVVRWVASDGSNNTSSCSFEVTVEDDELPSVTPPPSVHQFTGSGSEVCGIFISSAALGNAEYNDNCSGGGVTVSGIPADNIFPVGLTTLIYTATDASGNSSTASQAVTITDNTAPVFSNCPANQTIYTGAGNTGCSQTATWTAPSVADNCGVEDVVSTHAPGSVFTAGVSNVIYTATDVNGNTSTCGFTITVIDNTVPVVNNCPADITVYTGSGNSNCMQTATWTEPSATDNCSGALTYLSRSDVPGSSFNKGSTIVRYVFEDGAGNQSTCSFVVNVIDNTGPVISNCPGSQTVAAGVNCQAAVTWTEPTAADNCDGVLSYFSRSHIPGSNFGLGTTTVSYVFKDAAGNESTCSFDVTVTDNTLPVITNLSANPDVMWPPDRKMRDIVLSYSATDNCGCTPVVSVSSNEAVHGTGDGDRAPDWEVIDNTHIKLRAERGNGRDARVYTIRVSCTDLSGNTSYQETEVRVAHNITNPLSGAPVRVGSTVNFSGVFWDKPGNKHSAQWLIDGSTTVKGTVTEPSGTKNGKVTGSYRFNTAGVYKLQMNVTDQNKVKSYCNTNEDLEAIVVVYDPNGGISYGGGWYHSPAGALTSDPSLEGKVSYGYSLNYFKGATNPKGETQFEFKVGELEFNALNFDYLVINGARAQMRGTGKIIGGQSGIGFITTVIDGEVDGSGIDRIRIKIYNRITNEIYYDNMQGASDADDPVMAVGNNSTIVVAGSPAVTIQRHDQDQDQKAAGKATLKISADPNPTEHSFRVMLLSDDKSPAEIEVTDMHGRIVERRKIVPNQVVDLGNRYSRGMYIISARQGKEVVKVKVVKSKM